MSRASEQRLAGLVREFAIPDGYRVEPTDERISEIGRRFFRVRAEAFRRAYAPLVPSYGLRIERVGWLKYAVVAYQNKLVKEEEA